MALICEFWLANLVEETYVHSDVRTTNELPIYIHVPVCVCVYTQLCMHTHTYRLKLFSYICVLVSHTYAPNTNMHQLGHTDDEQETYRERLAELDEEEFPEEEEEEEEEDEGDAKERIRGTLVEKFEEQTEVISTVQVRSLRAVCTQYACTDNVAFFRSPECS